MYNLRINLKCECYFVCNLQHVCLFNRYIDMAIIAMYNLHSNNIITT